MVVTDLDSSWNGQIVHLEIEDGKISNIQTEPFTHSVDFDGQKKVHISPSWFDIGAQSGEMGEEYRGTLAELEQAALTGGYAKLGIVSNESNPIDSPEKVNFYKNSTRTIDLLPLASMTKAMEGEEMVDFYELKKMGAIGFAEVHRNISPKLTKNLMEYTKSMDTPLVFYPQDYQMNEKGQINEGLYSTKTGLKGMPYVSEQKQVSELLHLATYTQRKIHFAHLSSRYALTQCVTAKEWATAQIPVHYLWLEDADMVDFDSNKKVMPPFRTKADKEALIDALVSGEINIVSTDHNPWDEENKRLEFGYAKFGVLGLETCFGAIQKALENKLSLDKMIDLISKNPKALFGVPQSNVEKGASADFTLFDPSVKWKVTQASFSSRATNSPFLGQTLKGKALGILKGDDIILSDAL